MNAIDVYALLLKRIKEGGINAEDAKNYIRTLLDENPDIAKGATAEQLKMIEDLGVDVSDLKQDLNHISDYILGASSEIDVPFVIFEGGIASSNADGSKNIKSFANATCIMFNCDVNKDYSIHLGTAHNRFRIMGTTRVDPTTPPVGTEWREAVQFWQDDTATDKTFNSESYRTIYVYLQNDSYKPNFSATVKTTGESKGAIEVIQEEIESINEKIENFSDGLPVDVTNYMLICETIEDKEYRVVNGEYRGLSNNGEWDSSNIVPLDKSKDLYCGCLYTSYALYFDADKNYITRSSFYFGTPILKDTYPSNAEYVAFSWQKNHLLTDKMYTSSRNNNYLPRKKYGKTIKNKGIRPIINIYTSDTQEEVFDKLADAVYTEDCDVYFEQGEYVFNTIYDSIRGYYGNQGDAFEMLLGGNCRYYMYGCTFYGQHQNNGTIGAGGWSTFGSHRHADNYELFGGTIVCENGMYCVHDEASGEDGENTRKYHDVTFKYVKGDGATYINKCLGCGTGKNTFTVIDGCYFESDNDLCVAEASWHGNNSTNDACEGFIDVKNSYFKNKGFYVDPIKDDSLQKMNMMFSNNSVNTKLPTDVNGWTLTGWNNEKRSS